MKILRATLDHETEVLKLLDAFREFCGRKIFKEPNFISTTAQDSGGAVFREVIRNENGAIFLAQDGMDFIGIVSIYKIPQIRKGCSCGEIEEIYVSESWQGKWVAQALLEAITSWARNEGISTIRLESSDALERAHSFYEKSWFQKYGKAYMKTFEI